MLRILYLDTTFMLPRRSIREGRVGQKCLTLFILLMIIKKGLRMTDTIIGIISIGIAGLVMVFLLIKICGG